MKRAGRLFASALVAAALAAGLGLWAANALAQTAQTATAKAPGAASTLEAAQLVEQAKTLMDQGKLQEAKAANDRALQLDPNLQDARVLDRVLARRIADAAGPAATTPGTVTEKGLALTNEQISRIRLFELGDNERARGTVDRKTLEDFWGQVHVKDPAVTATSQRDRDLFLAVNNFPTQLAAIRKSREKKFIDKVRVLDDPASLLYYRQKVNTYVLNNCANTAGCHGQENPKSTFRLLNKGGDTVANVYTNFYVMTQTKVGNGKMLDRDQPEESLFLQYGLPREQAKFPHPGKAQVRQVFRDASDPLFKTLSAWVGGLTRPVPDYGIEYALPTAATKPAEAP